MRTGATRKDQTHQDHQDQEPVTLGDFVGVHSTLFSLIGALTGLTAFATKLSLGWIEPYVQFLLLGAALLVWLELHSQWPRDLQLHRGRLPDGRPWRFVAFAYMLQLATVAFAGYVLWTLPDLVASAVAVGVVAVCGVLGWRALERTRGKRRRDALLARLWLVVSIAAAFLLSELLLEIFASTHRSVFVRTWQAIKAVAR